MCNPKWPEETHTEHFEFHPHYLVGQYFLEDAATGHKYFLWFGALQPFPSLPGKSPSHLYWVFGVSVGT
jgi:hypothetical protein